MSKMKSIMKTKVISGRTDELCRFRACKIHTTRGKEEITPG